VGVVTASRCVLAPSVVIVSGRCVSCEQAGPSRAFPVQTDATVDAPPKRGRGRPPGIPAWNKGIAISEAHRKRISLKLQQKWKDPEFKRSVSAGLAGKSAWNAGQAHPPETRAKMAEAKLGKRQPLATRKLIAAANTGRSLSEDARAKVGDRFRGQPKSPEHRSKLASMARRRHAAARVLRAVEAVYSAASAAQPAAGSAAGPPQRVPASGGAMASAGGAGSSPPAGSPAGLGSGAAPPGAAAPNLGAVRAAAYSMGLTGLSSGSGKRLSRTQILNTFKAELREYRTLQARPAESSPRRKLPRPPSLPSHPGPLTPLPAPQASPPAASIFILWPLLPHPPLPFCRRSCPPGRLPSARRTTASQTWWTCSAPVSSCLQPCSAAWRPVHTHCAGAHRLPPLLSAHAPAAPPSPAPAAAAGIPWLIDKFKQYVVLRDRLFSDTSVLRGKLQESIPGVPGAWKARRAGKMLDGGLMLRAPRFLRGMGTQQGQLGGHGAHVSSSGSCAPPSPLFLPVTPPQTPRRCVAPAARAPPPWRRPLEPARWAPPMQTASAPPPAPPWPRALLL
jgi:hypothetical protein